jgi:hypothetical protein
MLTPAARRAAERQGLDAIGVRAYKDYLRVRDWARQVAARTGAVPTLTEQEQHAVADLASLWNASPEMVANLRPWCAPMGGGRAADYGGEGSSPLGKRIRRDLKRLSMQVGRELFVPEPSILGGFGYGTAVDRCNAATLMFFNVLVAMQDGAVLQECRHAAGRRLVWEIGGGWGGFAYQLKTVCPNVTYVITGAPDAFLVSAVYVMAAFPDARCRFYGECSVDELWRDWEEVDFVFAPESALATLGPPRLDLIVDIMSLRAMTPGRVAAHVQHAFDAGGRYFYSLHPGGWADETPAVWSAIDASYWPHPVPPRVEIRKAHIDYSHLIGWRRLRV